MSTLFHNRKLPNYLRTYRRRAGFSQDDVALLLGGHSGAKVSRLEKFRRQPTLQTALAYEAIFLVPVRELFAGQYQRIEREVRRRAERLARKLSDPLQSRLAARKLEALKIICPLRTPDDPQNACPSQP